LKLGPAKNNIDIQSQIQIQIFCYTTRLDSKVQILALLLQCLSLRHLFSLCLPRLPLYACNFCHLVCSCHLFCRCCPSIFAALKTVSKEIVERKHGEPIRFLILPKMGLLGSQAGNEKSCWLWIMSNFWGLFFHVFMSKNYYYFFFLHCRAQTKKLLDTKGFFF
jgi:hypothetical protein